jgi:L-cysteine/cystine lyase
MITAREIDGSLPKLSRPMDVESFRAEFPVFERRVYMNTGTDGPIPARAVEAAQAEIDRVLREGRAGKQHWEGIKALRAELRKRIARLMGCDTTEVALTGSATDGINTALHALGLGRGDEVLTTDEEHPGILAPLGRARRRGVNVRVVPWDDLAGAVGPDTKLIACSHVSWVTGRVADTEALKATGVPLLYDGAQGLGAIPVDVRELGCDFYAAAGQKWLCGPDGTGYLYVRGDRCAELDASWPSYMSLAEHGDALGLEQAEGAARFDMGVAPSGTNAWAAAAYDVLDERGFETLHERAVGLAERLAGTLRERGLEVAPRGRSTLVSWRSDSAEDDVLRLWDDGIVVRDLPGRGLVRASIGAWATEDELERLASAVA